MLQKEVATEREREFFSLFLYLWFNHENLADEKQFWAQMNIFKRFVLRIANTGP